MGLYDRPYYEQESSFSFSAGRIGNVVKTLITINVVIAIADFLSPDIGSQFNPPRPSGESRWFSNFLMLKPHLFSHPWDAWQLLTAGFAHAPLSSPRMMHILGNMFTLFVFGRSLEERFGSREFLRVYLALIVGANLIWVIAQAISGTSASLLGASGAISGLVVMFALLFPHRKIMMLFFPVPMPAWIFGLIIVGMDFLGALGQRAGGVAYVVHLAGAALGFLYLKSGIRLTDYFGNGFSMPKFGFPFGKPKLKVHRPQKSTRHRLDRRADEILAKLHSEGADSITPEERKILDDYSRRMRQKHS